MVNSVSGEGEVWPSFLLSGSSEEIRPQKLPGSQSLLLRVLSSSRT